MKPGFSVRAATTDITPNLPYPLGGFASRTDPATGTHRPLEGVAVVVSTGSDRVAWIGVDVLAITSWLREIIVATLTDRFGFSSDEIIVVATHTHSAPAVWHGTIHPVLPARFDPAAAARVAERIADALAAQAERPAIARFGMDAVHGVGSNRHAIGGPVDNSTGALSLTDAESGEPLAVVFDYACHPTVLGEQNLLYSPDWVGGARDRIRASFGAALPVLYLPGASGDVSTRFLRRERTPDEASRLGGIVGAAVVAALLAGTPLAAGPLELHRRFLRAPTRTSFDDVTSGAADEPREQVSARLIASIAEGAASRLAYRDAEVPAALDVPLTLVRLGTCCWLHTPFEVGTELARAIVAGDESTRFVGYSDGYDGYLADAESARAGHYEASASYFDVATTKRLVAQMADELRGMSTASS